MQTLTSTQHPVALRVGFAHKALPIRPIGHKTQLFESVSRSSRQVPHAAADVAYTTTATSSTTATTTTTPQPASPAPVESFDDSSDLRMSEAGTRALQKATQAVKRFGWISFWIQLTMSCVSGIILLFSVAFTSQAGPKASLYLTLVGIVAGLLSTAWNFSYTRLGMKMQQYLDLSKMGREGPKIKKQQVLDTVIKGVLINLVGLGATLLGIQSLVGMLVAKTLSNASAGPALAGMASGNSLLALDVFLVQAATNSMLAHFLSMCCGLWLLHVVGEGKPLKFQNLDPDLEMHEAASKKSPASKLVPTQGGEYQLLYTDTKVVLPPSYDEGDIDTQSPRARRWRRLGEQQLTQYIREKRRVRRLSRARPDSTDEFLPYATPQSLRYLDGSLPGDQGFDPLGLYDPQREGGGLLYQQRLRYSEIVHGRWAMLGVVGCLWPEYVALDAEHNETMETGTAWFRSVDLDTLTLVLLAGIGYVEVQRFQDFVKGNVRLQRHIAQPNRTTVVYDPTYPGGRFDPLSVEDSVSILEGQKEKEVKHGRLAMVAFAGMVVQAIVTGEGPLQNFLDHVKNPIANNVVTSVARAVF